MKEIKFDDESKKDSLKKSNYYHYLHFLQFKTFATILIFFPKINKKIKHIDVLLLIFFALGVFQNFDSQFLTLLKAEKVVS